MQAWRLLNTCIKIKAAISAAFLLVAANVLAGVILAIMPIVSADPLVAGTVGPDITSNCPSGNYWAPIRAAYSADGHVTNDGAGISMYYTTDGSAPTIYSPVYTGAFVVKLSETVRILAYDSHGTSSTATFVYTIDPLSAPQLINPGDYISTNSTNMTLQWHRADNGASDVMYQLQMLKDPQDFTDTGPLVATTPYQEYTVSGLSGGTWLWRVRACDTGCTRLSDWSKPRGIIVDMQAPPAPVPDIGSGTYNTAQRVTFYSTSPDVIRISVGVVATSHGHHPYQTCAHNNIEAGCPFIVSASETIEATATDMAGNSSPPVTYTYIIDTVSPSMPAATLLPGTYAGPKTLMLSATDNAGGTGLASIYYTADGSTPDKANGTVYVGPILVDSSRVIKTVAYDAAGNMSAVAAFAYDITSPLVPLAGTDDGTGDGSGSAAAPDAVSTLASPVVFSNIVTNPRYTGSGYSVANAAVAAPPSVAGTAVSVGKVKGAHTGGPASLDAPKPAIKSSHTFLSASRWWLIILAVIVAVYLAYKYRRDRRK